MSEIDLNLNFTKSKEFLKVAYNILDDSIVSKNELKKLKKLQEKKLTEKEGILLSKKNVRMQLLNNIINNKRTLKIAIKNHPLYKKAKLEVKYLNKSEIKVLQKSVGSKADGWFGPNTFLSYINSEKAKSGFSIIQVAKGENKSQLDKKIIYENISTLKVSNIGFQNTVKKKTIKKIDLSNGINNNPLFTKAKADRERTLDLEITNNIDRFDFKNDNVKHLPYIGDIRGFGKIKIPFGKENNIFAKVKTNGDISFGINISNGISFGNKLKHYKNKFFNR